MRFFIVISLFLILISCEKQTDWQYDDNYNSLLVVEATLTNEIKPHLVKLTKSSLSDTLQLASGATITISDGTYVDVLEEIPIGSACYYTDSNFIAVVGKRYLMTITYEGVKFIAASYAVPVSNFAPLSYSYSAEKQMYKIDWVAGVYDAQNPAMYEITVDWTAVAGYENANPDTCIARMYYYSLPTLDVNQIFTINKEKVYFPKGSLITESKYSLTKEHADFIRSMLSETEWRGGFFDAYQSNVKTNLSFGATGYFATCMVIRKSYLVN